MYMILIRFTYIKDQLKKFEPEDGFYSAKEYAMSPEHINSFEIILKIFLKKIFFFT